MVKFTQAQKEEFEKLYNDRDKLSVLEAMLKVQKYELEYPVLYYFLFGSEDNCKGQNEFAEAWLNPDKIEVSTKFYYLVIFPSMYVSEYENETTFTAKYDNSRAYQKQFTQLEIDELQQTKDFKNKVNLDACKVEVSEDDKNNPPTATQPPDSGIEDGDSSEDTSGDETDTSTTTTTQPPENTD